MIFLSGGGGEHWNATSRWGYWEGTMRRSVDLCSSLLVALMCMIHARFILEYCFMNGKQLHQNRQTNEQLQLQHNCDAPFPHCWISLGCCTMQSCVAKSPQSTCCTGSPRQRLRIRSSPPIAFPAPPPQLNLPKGCSVDMKSVLVQWTCGREERIGTALQSSLYPCRSVDRH